MNLNVIKLNPSQEVRLKKARADFFGNVAPLDLDKKSGLFRQKIKEDGAIFLEPLLCVLPKDFGKDDFLAITRIEIKGLQAQDSGALYYFPALIESGGRHFQAAIPCAFGFELAKNFDLQKIFAAAQSAAQSAALFQDASQDQKAAPQSDADKKKRGQDLVLAPTSFYFARAEIAQNTWSLYDALWKKLA